MDSKKRENILKVLEHMRKHPLMYFSSEVPAVATFLEGFKMALLLANPTDNFGSVFQDVILGRGWKVSAQAVWHQMQERGYDDEAIIEEMLLIYSAVWEKLLHQPVVQNESNPKT